MGRKVFVVVQKDNDEGRSWVEGVFGTESLAKEYIVQRQAELVEDEMDDSYSFRYTVEDFVEE